MKYSSNWICKFKIITNQDGELTFKSALPDVIVFFDRTTTVQGQMSITSGGNYSLN